MLFALLSTSLFLASCSKSLSRDQAEKLIKEKYHFPQDEIIDLCVYDATTSWVILNELRFANNYA